MGNIGPVTAQIYQQQIEQIIILLSFNYFHNFVIYKKKSDELPGRPVILLYCKDLKFAILKKAFTY